MIIPDWAKKLNDQATGNKQPTLQKAIVQTPSWAKDLNTKYAQAPKPQPITPVKTTELNPKEQQVKDTLGKLNVVPPTTSLPGNEPKGGFFSNLINNTFISPIKTIHGAPINFVYNAVKNQAIEKQKGVFKAEIGEGLDNQNILKPGPTVTLANLPKTETNIKFLTPNKEGNFTEPEKIAPTAIAKQKVGMQGTGEQVSKTRQVATKFEEAIQTIEDKTPLGKIANGINTTFQLYSDLAKKTYIPQIIGSAVKAGGEVIGSGIGTIGQTGIEIVKALQGKGFDFNSILREAENVSKSTGEFGYSAGEQGTIMAPLGGLDKLGTIGEAANLAMMYGQGYQGVKDLTEGLSSGNSEQLANGLTATAMSLFFAYNTVKGFKEPKIQTELQAAIVEEAQKVADTKEIITPEKAQEILDNAVNKVAENNPELKNELANHVQDKVKSDTVQAVNQKVVELVNDKIAKGEKITAESTKQIVEDATNAAARELPPSQAKALTDEMLGKKKVKPKKTEAADIDKLTKKINDIQEKISEKKELYRKWSELYKKGPKNYKNIPKNYKNIPKNYKNIPKNYKNIPKDLEKLQKEWGKLFEERDKLSQQREKLVTEYHQPKAPIEKTPESEAALQKDAEFLAKKKTPAQLSKEMDVINEQMKMAAKQEKTEALKTLQDSWEIRRRARDIQEFGKEKAPKTNIDNKTGKPIIKEYPTINEGNKVKMVKGEPVNIVDWANTFIHKGDGGWVVSESTTGRFIAESRTREGVIAKADVKLNDVGKEKFLKTIKKYKLKTPVKKTKIEAPQNAPVAPGEAKIPEVAKSTIEPEKPLKTSKIAKSINQKAIEAGLTEGFKDLAGYEPRVIKEQAAKISELMKEDFEGVRQMIRGEKPVPKDISPTYLIKSMEDYLVTSKDGQLAADLANSPLVSETSIHASELRMAAERTPNSITSRLAEAKKGKEKLAEKRLAGRTKEVVKSGMKEKLTKNFKKADGKVNWKSFAKSITC